VKRVAARIRSLGLACAAAQAQKFFEIEAAVVFAAGGFGRREFQVGDRA